MKKKLTALVLSMTMAATLLAGCGNTDNTTTAATTTASTTSSSTTAATTASSTWNITAEDYSYGFDDTGYLTGVKASDYVKLPDFKDIVIYEADIAATDSQISEIKEDLLANCMDKIYDGTVQDGDTVQISYVGYIGDEAFSGGSTGDDGTQVTIGVTNYIDDFLEQLIGHKVGDDVVVEVTFPDDYDTASLAGKDATFYTKILYICQTPEYNDDLITNHLSDIQTYFSDESITSLKDVDEFMEAYFREYNLGNAVSNELSEIIEGIEPPQEALDAARMQIEISVYSSYGMKLEDFVSRYSAYGYDEDYVNTSVNNQAAYYIFYQAIAEQENWEITDEELTKTFDDGTYTLEKYIEFYGRGYLAEYMIYANSYEYVMGAVTIE